jgi:Flp pilus assembly protein TadB
MTDPDLMDFAELWQQEPTAEEHAHFEAAARKVRTQGRFLAFADVALAVVLVSGMIVGFFLQPGTSSAIIAGLFIVATVWLSLKHRKVRHMARTLDTSDRHAFIASSIRYANASLRRAVLSMCFLPTFALLAVLFKLNLRSGGHLDHPLTALANWAISTRGVIGLTGLAIIMVFLVRAWRKSRSEIARLNELENAYRKATSMDDADNI